MKKTKRQQNSMIINLVLNGALFLIFVLIFTLYIYPNIVQISDEKHIVTQLSNDIARIDASGINFDEFINLRTTQKEDISDVFTQKLLDKVEPEFYETHMGAAGSGTFLEYISSLESQLVAEERDISDRNTDIESILPAYGDYVTDSGDVITDFDFTSYLERLFTTFNLQYDGKIGIGELEPIGVDDSDQSNAQQELNASLYSTNLKLDIAGRKKDIINFVHYFENVGSIDIQDDELELYGDDVITQFGRQIVLSGDNRTTSYNIYLHQLGDIEYIRMNTYIDASLDTRDLKLQSLQEFVSQTQGDQRFEFEISLNFYFKGLPKYKVTEFITDFIVGHNTMKKIVQSEISKLSTASSASNQDRQYLGQLKSIDIWLNDTTIQVQILAKDLRDPTKVEAVYKEVLDLKQNLDTISVLIETHNTQSE